MSKELFLIGLSEAKDSLRYINNAIRETRNKIFVYFGLLLGIVSYFAADVLAPMNNNVNPFTTRKSIILYGALLCAAYAFYVCKSAMLPIKLRREGIEPEIFERVAGKGEDYARDSLLHGYQISITTNNQYLETMSAGIRRAFIGLMLFAGYAVFCVIALALLERTAR
jgi:hypothetical protein